MTEEQKKPVHEPFDVELESALLGCLIRDNSLIPQAMGIVEDGHFYDPMHARIFAQIAEWAMEGDRSITALTLSAAMKSDPGISEIPVGRDYFKALELAAPSVPAVRSFALTIRELSHRRDALWALEDAKSAITSSPTLVRDALRPVITVGDEAERFASMGNYQSTLEAAEESIRDAEQASTGKKARAVKFRITKLNDEVGGFQGADFIPLAGKSGMGKSALMCAMSWQAAEAFVPTIVFSLEMKRKPWVQRILTDIEFHLRNDDGGIAYRKFRSSGIGADGKNLGFSQEDFHRVISAKDHLASFHPWLEIHDDDGLTINQIASRAKAFQAKWRNDPMIREMQGLAPDEEPIGLVLVDYIQIMEMAPGKFQRSREQEVASFARGLKGLAKKLDWPVVAGSQLNEDDKARGKEAKRPQASDVRESKAIRHEADIMLLLYRMAEALRDAQPDATPGERAWIDWKDEVKRAENHFDLIIAKNRMGRRLTLNLWGDMTSSSICDEKPVRRKAQQEADDLLRDLNG